MLLVKEGKSERQISEYLEKSILKQTGFEQGLDKKHRKQNGVFLTNSLDIVENVLNIIDIDTDIFNKKILEPSCGQGIFILKLIGDIYSRFPDNKLISSFITNNLYFVDVQESMINKTISNIQNLYYYLFNQSYTGTFNSIAWDFTDKEVTNNLFDELKETPFTTLYNLFDYVIGNPPYVTLYGRRDKKQNEEQRVNYLKNYNQFPAHVKNGKLNFVMLFIEHSLDFLKEEGELSFIIDVSFFETAYQYTRRYLLEKTQILELQVNINDFDVASGQVILKVKKSNDSKNNSVKVIDWKMENTYFIPQSSWSNHADEYKFRYNGCNISSQIIDKVKGKGDKTLLELFPNKNLRTCVMLLDMEEKFTFYNSDGKDASLTYPYYQGSKALSEKYGKLNFTKYFIYDKQLQDTINDALKIQLEKENIKNKKRIGFGEPIIYDNPKIYIRQSAKEIIASIDLKRSAANNSLYVFSLRSNTPEDIDILYFLCGWLNSDFLTYYSQKMNIIRYSQGKQPQIKTSDLASIFIPSDKMLKNEISNLCKMIYKDYSLKDKISSKINALIYQYYELSNSEIESITKAIQCY
jgi:tRNA1(Val) A37 N6-methylase TrmN6